MSKIIIISENSLTELTLLHLEEKKTFRISKDASHSSHCFVEKNDKGIVELSLTLLTQPMVNDKIYSMFENSLTLLTLV